MKKFMKPMLFCILLGLMLIMPDKISANKASTADTFYYYENGHAQYNGQKTLVVMDSIPFDSTISMNVELPVMKSVTKLVIQSGVKDLSRELFAKCPNVKTVKICKGVKELSDLRCLGELKKLKTITVQTGNKAYKAKDNVLYSYNMKTLVAYPSAKTNSTYTMPSTVTWGFNCFDCNPYLKKVTISKNYSSNEFWGFDNISLPNLEKIAVAAGNKKFTTKDGILYTRNMKTVLYYPNGKKSTTYTIPSTVKTIGNCFGTNKYLKTLVFGKNVATFNTDFDPVSAYLPKLTNIKVASGNKHFAAYNGALYTAGYKELVYCARGKVKPYRVKAATKLIQSNAFSDCKITEITFQKGLKEIEPYAFCNSPVKHLELPSTIEKVYPLSIHEMPSLESISVRKGCTAFYSKDGILFNNDGSVMLWPENCHPKELTINANSSGRVRLNGYPNLKDLETIHIGKDVKDISAYRSMNRLKEIILDSENKNLHLYDGVLYNADYSKIVLYPNQNPNTSVTLHKDLKELKQSWFSGENNTEELILPDGLEKIETNYTYAEGNQDREAGREQEWADYETAEANDEDTNSQDREVLPSFKNSLFQNLKKITISADNAYFTCKDNVLYNKDMTALVWYPVNRDASEYTLPDSVIKLNAQLREAKNLKNIKLNCNVKSTVEYLGAYSDTLESITVPKENPNYTSIDGVLYSKDMTSMLVYPNEKIDTSYTLPETVTYARFNFKNNYLEKLTLSPNLKEVTRYPNVIKL